MLSSAMRIELDPETRPTVSVDEAAIVLGISRSAAYAAAKSGELPVVQFGRRLRVPTAALARMLELNTVDPPPAA
jgi:excisionase family DNA binding protein